MIVNKFEPGDKVIVIPRLKQFRGQIYTIKKCHAPTTSRGVLFVYYSVNETKWTFMEEDLIPYVEPVLDENLISSLDLSSLFKEGL